MEQIKVGSLVKAFRRQKGGVGLVIKRQYDLAEHVGLDLCVVQNRRALEKESAQVALEWWNEVEEAIQNSDDPQVAREFLAYNHYGKKKKLKKDFVYVKWIQKPSEYAQYIGGTEGWIPTDWLCAL